MLALSTQEYALESPRDGWAEMDAEIYWRAVAGGIRDVRSRAPGWRAASIGLSSQGQTFVLLDKAHRPIRPAVVWLDLRAQKEVDELLQKLGPEAWRVAHRLSLLSGHLLGPEIDLARPAGAGALEAHASCRHAAGVHRPSPDRAVRLRPGGDGKLRFLRRPRVVGRGAEGGRHSEGTFRRREELRGADRHVDRFRREGALSWSRTCRSASGATTS